MASLLGELGHRWSRARRAALLPLVGGAEGDEHALIAAVPAERWDEALQRVFDHSLRLADSFRRYNRQQLSIADVAAYLPALGLDCLSTCAARPRADAMELVRGPCAAQPTMRLCNYTRECTLGMTLGLTDGAVRHARHRSAAHGDGECLDVLFLDPESHHRYGPIPTAIADELTKVASLLRRLGGGAEVEFLGVSEAQLAYRVRGPAGSLAVAAMIERMVRQRLPALTPVDTAPRAVLSETA